MFDCGLHLLEKAIGKRRGGKGSANSEDFAGTSATSVGLQNVAAGAGDVEGQAPESVLQASAEDAINGEDAINTEDERMEFHHAVGHNGYMVADLYEKHGQDAKALVRMGIFIGIALGFHNFPEGLATFVAVLDNPKVGASVAVAIGIHNIPEGICVAMPIYYATGSRWKAFFWATISGCTELIGALLGWIVLRKVFTQLVYGILFGIVSGMMVYISLAELLPTAHRYDPEDKVTTLSVFVGMVVMALSLVLVRPLIFFVAIEEKIAIQVADSLPFLFFLPHARSCRKMDDDSRCVPSLSLTMRLLIVFVLSLTPSVLNFASGDSCGLQIQHCKERGGSWLCIQLSLLRRQDTNRSLTLVQYPPLVHTELFCANPACVASRSLSTSSSPS